MTPTATKTKNLPQDSSSTPPSSTEDTNSSRACKKKSKKAESKKAEEVSPPEPTSQAFTEPTLTEKASPKPTLPTPRSGIDISCSQQKLKEQLSLLSLAVPSKPTHPILGNVLIVVDELQQEVTLMVYDLSLGIKTKFPTKVNNPGELALPVKLLNDIVLRVPSDCTIELENSQTGLPLTEENVVCTVRADSGRYQINGMSALEFPVFPEVKSGLTASLPVGILLQGLKRSSFAASSDETKQVLTGVHIKLEQENVQFAATDGHRLAVVEISIQGLGKKQAVIPEPFEFTCPRSALGTLERMLSMLSDQNSFEAVEIAFDSSSLVAFTTPNAQLVGRCFSGEYPAYQELLKREFKQQITVEKAPLIVVLERIGILADKKEKTVRLEFDAKEQRICLSIAREFGSGVETLPACINGDSISLAFNLKYLLDGIKNVPSSDVQIHLTTESGPAILTQFGTRDNPSLAMDLKYLLMPLVS